MTESNETELAIPRRTLMKAGAWAAPVVAMAAAAPLASASVNNADVYWDGARFSILTLSLLEGGTINASADALPTFPSNVIIDNGPGDITGVITGVVNITYAGGLPVNVSLTGHATARGFGGTSIPGAVLGSRTTTRKELASIGIPPFALTWGVYQTSQSFTLTTTTIAGGADAVLGQIAYGATAKQALISVNVLVSYNVEVIIYVDGTELDRATDTIIIPAGAGIL